MTDAPVLLELHLGDDPAAWTRAGFTVVDGRVRLGALVLVCAADGSAPLLGFDRPTDLDGAPSNVVAAPTEDAAPAHPNGIDGFDHVVIMAPHLDRVRAAVRSAGFEIRRERPTRLGDAEITQLFVWAGPVLLEIVAPTTGDDPGGPSQVWGLAAISPDLDATATWFGDRISSPRTAVQAGRRIATVRHRDVGIGVQLAVMTGR